MPIGIKDTGIALQNSIIIFLIVLTIGPLLNIHYVQILNYEINIYFLISMALSFYLLLCIVLGLINIIFGKEDGMQIIINAFIMWLPTLLIPGSNNGYVCLMFLINLILSYIISFISRFF